MYLHWVDFQFAGKEKKDEGEKIEGAKGILVILKKLVKIGQHLGYFIEKE